MIPTPIRQVLFTIQKHGTQTLLMGGQACIFYGAAQVSKDVDFLVLAGEENLARLLAAMDELEAPRIAVPPFDEGILARGHAVHFRCRAPGAEGLRVDVMTRLRDLSDFAALWERRTVFSDAEGNAFHLLSIPDLVQAKKTQRTKDWPVIEALGAIHYRENSTQPRADWIDFWLAEIRTPELLAELIRRFPDEAAAVRKRRPLLALADDLDALRTALDAEMRAEQAKDRAYWEPLRRELEEFRRAERGKEQG